LNVASLRDVQLRHRVDAWSQVARLAFGTSSSLSSSSLTTIPAAAAAAEYVYT